MIIPVIRINGMQYAAVVISPCKWNCINPSSSSQKQVKKRHMQKLYFAGKDQVTGMLFSRHISAPLILHIVLIFPQEKKKGFLD